MKLGSGISTFLSSFFSVFSSTSTTGVLASLGVLASSAVSDATSSFCGSSISSIEALSSNFLGVFLSTSIKMDLVLEFLFLF